MTDFLQLSGKTVLVFGVANRKSVAWFVAQSLEEAGALQVTVHALRSQEWKKNDFFDYLALAKLRRLVAFLESRTQP